MRCGGAEKLGEVRQTERNSTSSAPERKVEDVNLGLQRFSLPAPQHCWHRSIPQVN